MVVDEIIDADDATHSQDDLKKKNRKRSRKSKSKTEKRKRARRATTKAKAKVKKKVIRYNPLEHVMVPKHEIVSEEEKVKLMEMYGDLNLFPKMFVTDPAAVRLGAKPGDLIKIIRPGDTHPYYRLVISREV